MARRVNLIYWFLLALLVLVLGLTGTCWLLLQGSLPKYEGEASISALSAPVVIERDALGSVTLHAQDRLDLARALGYVHAQERFLEMDLMRRSAAGELAELFGAAALPADRKARGHRMRARATAMLSELPESQRQLIDAYRDGVNEGLTKLAVRPFPYLLTRTQPHPWHSADTLLVVISMYFTLQEPIFQRELQLSTLRAGLPETVYQFLTAPGGEWDAPLTGAPFEWPQLPSSEVFNLRKSGASLKHNLPHHRNDYHDEAPGSNSFAVAGSLAEGAALIANDMHLTLRTPSLWFRTRIIYPHSQRPESFIDTIGVSLPGTPAIVVGSNRHIAWSFTNSYGDTADWVRIMIDPADPSRYRSAKDWKSITVHRETLRVRGAPDETIEVRETEWGPILASDHDGIPLALVWAAHQTGAINMDLIELEQVETVDRAIVVAQQAGMPAQNFIAGDRDGHIAWTIAGRIPLRRGHYNPTEPANWSEGNISWQGWLEAAQYPVIINPQEQRLWSGNARMVDGDMLAQLGDGGYELGARARQIRDSLQKIEHFTPTDFFLIQLDDRALFLSRWRQLFEQILDQAPSSSWRTEMQEAMRDWDSHASVNSVAYRIVRTFRQEILSRILDNFTAEIQSHYPDFSFPRLAQIEHAIWLLIVQRPLHLLPPEYTSWDQLLESCAQRIAVEMQAQPGGIAARTWGEKNTAAIRHPLSRVLPAFIAQWLDMPRDPLPGDSYMPRIQSPNFGASQRFVVAPSEEEHGYFSMPGGQSGHPLSPYYGSGHADWVAGKVTPFLPGPPERTLSLLPFKTSQ
ncbi:penicillin acylase family protein [Nitrosomonas communis]|uniref:Penicillin amidase n=1 Tax=Nitrosomonas communis TaxID=44574 RepID=A0A1H2XP94_9PROT|nr:penicillin acylase family protein [Nitrosomonas communis]SDW94294.1 penicillin amidase [Nitrosomonas communis]